ncbi:tetratricopeptide repeat protein [Candidatus Poribacteria bacterium]|nr:tetratricopeptide repeat protein [Candidatus Poribacteria bacterium]MYK22117.1 tetratricopeptide repeat protein [Candidatus Poribacteria bacterium]
MRHYTKFLFCFLVLAVFLSFSCAQKTAEEPTEANLISDKAKESTVRLVGFSKRGSELGLGGGTGFFVAPDKIVTNFHVAVGVSGLMTAKLSHKETVWLVEGVVAYDIAYDIAILKVTGEGTPLSLGDSDILQIGEPIFLVGFPGRYTITEGVIERIRKNDKRFRTTAEAYPGNSGSPVLNSKGEVIGIHYGHDPGNSPVNAIKALLAGATSTEPFTQWRKRNDIRAYVYFEQGKQKYYDGDAKGAINDFNQVIELTPNDAKIYKFRAKSKVKLEDYHAAIEDYNQVIKLNPNDASVYKGRAEAKRKLSNHASAIDDYNQAIQLNPNDAFTYRASADAKRKSGDNAGAIADYNQAIKLNPEDAEAYKNSGKARAELGDYAKAIEDYSQALKLNPKNVFTYHDRADIKQKLGDYTGAIEDYNQVITKLKNGSFTYTYQTEHGLTTTTITPDDSYVYYVYNNRGWVKREQGDHTGAMEDFTRAIELKPHDAYAYKNRGVAKVALRDHAGAVEDFTHAINLKPDDPNAYHLRGHSKQALGQEEAAQIDFEKAKELETAQRKRSGNIRQRKSTKAKEINREVGK